MCACYKMGSNKNGKVVVVSQRVHIFRSLITRLPPTDRDDAPVAGHDAFSRLN